MKKQTTVSFCFLLLLSNSISAQTEKDVRSKITKVTVYSREVRIESSASFEMQAGKMILNFKNLSPFISKESIRIDGDGNYTILNVRFQNDYLNELEKDKEVDELTSSIQSMKDKIEDEETRIGIINEENDFLKANKNISGKDKSLNAEEFKSLNEVYGDNIEKNTLEILKRQRAVREYKKELDKLTNQLSSITSRNELPSGTIAVTIESKRTQSASANLSYMVENASWYPSFDIRYTGINKPLKISFKANIIQNSGVDWKDVELCLSTAKTNISAQIPDLPTNYLQFYQPKMYSELQGKAAGVQLSNSVGVTGSASEIRIRGNSSINNNPLYIVDGVPKSDMNSIDKEDIENIEVLKGESATALYGTRASDGVILVTTKKQKDRSNIPATTTSRNETSNEYTVELKQSITSDNKLNTITFREIELNAAYEYQAVPKLSKNVFLIGRITDPNKSDLLDGEANIYMENSYVGKSRINTQQYTDTMDISFGIDNNITVNREKIRDYSESQFIGSNKKDTYAWKLTLRNNKSYPVNVRLYDQVPVSSTKEIQVDVLELSGGIMNSNTGKVRWKIELGPAETRQVVIRYSVKYPKDQTVYVD